MKQLPTLSFPTVGGEGVAAVRGLLRSSGALLIHDMPIDSQCETLVAFAEALGTVSSHGIGEKSNRQRPDVHRIEPLQFARLDPFGNRVLSTTAMSMACHTDDSFSQDPVEVVILHCAVPGEGGDSMLAALEDVLTELASATISALEEPLFPTPNGWRPILTKSRRHIRFSEYEIAKMSAGGMPPCLRGVEAVAQLMEAIERVTFTRKLSSGDCLVLDNTRVLHGRTAILTSAPRLLFRIRLDKVWDHSPS